MIQRSTYIDKILPFINKPLIKILTGIRRSGKSVLLMLIKEELLRRNISESQIIYINFESLEYMDIDSALKLYKYIKGKRQNEEKIYILLDEIQNIPEWEKAINSFMVDFESDIYITGSNSRLLSSELATLLAGRYIEIGVETLSFNEYLEFARTYEEQPTQNIYASFERYLRMGGFPAIHTGDYAIESAYKIISDIYASVILRDTIQRNNIRNVELLNRLVRYLFDNVGNLFSAKNIADYFKSQQRKVDINTIYNYLSSLESAFILRKVSRYNIKSKEILKTNEKYYMGDHAFAYALMGYHDRWIGGVLENIVMLELARRGYATYVGKFDEKEIDFVAEQRNERIYIQVSYKLTDESTISREFSPLLAIDDHYPKYVVTMDDLWKDNIEGVKHIHIADFLLQEQW